MSLWKNILRHCLLPLVLGACIYLFFRPVQFTYLLVVKPLFSLNDNLRFITQLLPDFLWSYSFTSALYLYALYYKVSVMKMQPVIIFFVLGGEWIQKFDAVPFTYDFNDVCAGIFAILLSSLILLPRHEKVSQICSIE